tara:strand:- start:2496 stop:3980 length:1485 start_codon:yes stop_codon:yes gene_type:complete
MAYIINKTNGTQIAVVEDGTIDQTTDLKLVGKNYAGYGEIQNENFVHLLENFASANQPAKAIAGQMWFDSGSSKLKFYDGTKFRTTGGAEVSTTQPSGLTTGDFWWDSGNSQLYANTGSGFVLIGPQSQGSSVTQMLTAIVRDNAQVNRTVMKGIINDETVFIVSAVEFTIDSTDSNNAITGFDVVRAGLTLKNTTNATNGVTSTAHRYWGTASNADRLGGNPASEYVRSVAGQPSVFNEIARFSDAGFTVGASNDLVVKIENDNQAVIQNDVGTIIKFKVDNSSAQVKEPLNITADGILPSASATFNVGSATLKWNVMYANEFNGKATVASSMEVPVGQGTANRTASTAASNDTVAVRDGSGDLFASNFQGTALKANYADLAEKYTTDTQYPVGTIMTVGGDSEMTACAMTETPCGIISNKPGVVLNSDADGQAIALVGRTPLRVIGPVEKGDKLYVGANGTAQKANEGDLVGIALESNERFEEKLVEVFIKI